MFNNSFGSSRRTFGSSRFFADNQGSFVVDAAEHSSLISKVMILLAFSFLIAAVGTFIGFALLPVFGGGIFLVALLGLLVLLVLNFTVQINGLNLLLLYLFTLLEGISLSPLLAAYMSTAASSNVLGEAFLITALTTTALSVYAMTTKRNFSRLADYLFFGVILLVIVGFAGIFFGGLFNTGPLGLLISFIGVAVFSGYVLVYVQRLRTTPDSLPNAILATAGIFITVLNLFMYILQFLSILQGGRRR